MMNCARLCARRRRQRKAAHARGDPRSQPASPSARGSGDVRSDEEYEMALAKLQGRLASLTRRSRFGRHALVLAFEGMDAAGKGGAIRRITQALDARQYQVIPVGAPTAEEMRATRISGASGATCPSSDRRHDLRSFVVRPCARRTRSRSDAGGRLATRVRGNSRVRTGVHGDGVASPSSGST